MPNPLTLTVDEFEGSPVVAWARDLLATSFEAAASTTPSISLASDPDLHPEGFRLRRGRDGIVSISAGGPVGAAYALSDLADRARTASDPVAAFAALEDADEQPAVAVRGILRSFSSDRLDRGWLRDESFWT